eukprot:SAG31_NODE_618_length_13513_cov_87.043164_11_plen_174_part_00
MGAPNSLTPIEKTASHRHDATLPRGSVRNDSPADIKKWLAKESRLRDTPPPVTPLPTTSTGRRRRAPDRYMEVDYIDGCMHEQHQLQEFFQDLCRNDYDNYQDVWDDYITTERALQHDGYSILYNWFEDDGNSEVMFVSSTKPGQAATPSHWRGRAPHQNGVYFEDEVEVQDY